MTNSSPYATKYGIRGPKQAIPLDSSPYLIKHRVLDTLRDLAWQIQGKQMQLNIKYLIPYITQLA